MWTLFSLTELLTAIIQKYFSTSTSADVQFPSSTYKILPFCTLGKYLAKNKADINHSSLI